MLEKYLQQMEELKQQQAPLKKELMRINKILRTLRIKIYIYRKRLK